MTAPREVTREYHECLKLSTFKVQGCSRQFSAELGHKINVEQNLHRTSSEVCAWVMPSHTHSEVCAWVMPNRTRGDPHLTSAGPEPQGVRTLS